MTGVTRYASLWCPDFPSLINRDDKAVCVAKVGIFDLKLLILDLGF
jgi:hypothetical protein